MKWQETTLRKGTKTPKICRDMFITSSNGHFELCEVKNGRMFWRREITSVQLSSLHKVHQLVERTSKYFYNCSTRRTSKSWEVVDMALGGICVWDDVPTGEVTT